MPRAAIRLAATLDLRYRYFGLLDANVLSIHHQIFLNFDNFDGARGFLERHTSLSLVVWLANKMHRFQLAKNTKTLFYRVRFSMGRPIAYARAASVRK